LSQFAGENHTGSCFWKIIHIRNRLRRILWVILVTQCYEIPLLLATFADSPGR